MDTKSKFLPDSVSGALKTFAMRVLGGAIAVFGVWLIVGLVLHDPYLQGFAASSTAGRQSVVGNIVAFVRYAIGFVPAMFVFLCVARRGLALVFGWQSDVGPEYNFLRGFIATCCGAMGFGMLVPAGTFGGMVGAIVAADASALIGSWSVLLGLGFLGGFFVLGGMLLHIKWAHVHAALRRVYAAVRWILAAFHLTHYAHALPQDDADDTDAADEYEEEEADGDTTTDAAPVPKASRRGRSRAISAPVAPSVRRAAAGQYQLPDPAFLQKSVFGKNVITPELKQNAVSLQDHFEEFGVYGKVVGIRPGPIITLYEFQPDTGVRNAKVMETIHDMTRVMATDKMRMSPIARTNFIGVEVANLKPQTVRFRGMVENPMFVESKYKIPLALGVDIGGNPMYFDLVKMPHMLIAGRTGSGKSVFVQSIITSLLYHFTPDKCKLMIIDPKGVDFGFWDDIPHLITPIVKQDAAASVNALKWAVREMEERYKQMQLVNARNIESYNEIVTEKRAKGEVLTRQVAVGTDEETGELLYETQQIDISDMPYIVIIVDEVAELMVIARKEVEACLQRIAQKARAAGIHLIMATQRPDAQTITGVIKANFPTRVSFQARSYTDSMTTLGEKGAEQLLACGDMLFSEAGHRPVRIHGAFISDEELTKIGDFLRAQGEPEYASGVTDGDDAAAVTTASAPSAAEVRAEKDGDLYEQAKEWVMKDKRPTISYIQRRLKVGYNKAAGFIERMEEEGIISAPDANGKRQIL